MHIEVVENPNCGESPLQVFQELSPPKVVQQIRLTMEESPVWCWVTGIDKGGSVCAAWAQKVSDSGAGVSILIYGGEWGIRFKRIDQGDEPWDLSNSRQWGEPYLFYGDEGDLKYA